MAGWQRLPAVPRHQSGCLNCRHDGDDNPLLPMDAVIAVGFGFACLMKGQECVWDEMEAMRSGKEFDDFMTVEQAEALAVADPDHDWRIVMHGPMRGATFQRQAEKQWVCVESNEGFA